jgi:hypothetical protein
MNRFISILLLSAIFIFFGCGKGGDQPNDKQKSEEKTGIKSLDDFVDKAKEVQKKYGRGKNMKSWISEN